MKTKEIVAEIGMEVLVRSRGGNSETVVEIDGIDGGTISTRKIFKGVKIGDYTAFFKDFVGKNGENIVTPDYAGSTLLEKDSIYVIEPSSETHEKLEAIWKRGHEVNSIAFDYITELGGDAFLRAHCFAGGVLAVRFPKGRPSREWAYYDKKKNLYMPVQKAWVLKDAIKALPTIENAEVNKVVGFPDFQTHGRIFVFRPGIEKIIDQFIIHVDAGLYFIEGNDKKIISKADYYRLKGE